MNFVAESLKQKNACNSHRGKCKKNPDSKGVSEKWLKAMKDLNHSEGCHKGSKNSQFGTHWYTNGEINIKAKECPEGFKPGRI